MDPESNTDLIPVKLHCYAFTPGEKKSIPVDRDQVPSLLSQGARVWVDIEAPTDDEVEWLRDVFDFHELTLVDVMNNAVRPKQESFGDVLFTVFSAINLNEDQDQLDTINLNIFLTDRYIISTHLRPLKTIRDTVRAMARSRDPLSRGTDYVYYLLLDGVVNRYLDVMDEVDESLVALEHDVFETPSRDIQEKIFREKRRLAYLKRSITPKRDAVRDLVHDDFPQITEEVRLLIRDVLDHILRIVDAIESYRELTTGLMDSYMTNISNRMNEVMKLMSIIATVMLPLSFLTGLFGMNFDVIPGLHLEYGFWALMAFMMILASFLAWFFKRKGII